jgi:hypothetical protein
MRFLPAMALRFLPALRFLLALRLLVALHYHSEPPLLYPTPTNTDSRYHRTIIN